MKKLKKINKNDFLIVILIFGLSLMAIQSISLKSLPWTAVSLVILISGNIFVFILLTVGLIKFLIDGYKKYEILNIKNNILVLVTYILGILYVYPKITFLYTLISKGIAIATATKVISIQTIKNVIELFTSVLSIQSEPIYAFLNMVFIFLIIYIVKKNIKEKLYKKIEV